MKKLGYYIRKDARIRKVYDFSKQRFESYGSLHYPFGHSLRVLYRCLLIAGTEKGADYGVLIPAALLHDIGATVKGKEHHIGKGLPLAKRMLTKFGYDKEEISRIVGCIRKHGGLSVKNPVMPKTIEEKILWDADLLEKSGIAGAFSSYAVQLEHKKPVKEFAVERARGIRKKAKSFFTRKAKEIDGGGMKELAGHFEKVAGECRRRKDWTITEKDIF